MKNFDRPPVRPESIEAFTAAATEWVRHMEEDNGSNGWHYWESSYGKFSNGPEPFLQDVKNNLRDLKEYGELSEQDHEMAESFVNDVATQAQNSFQAWLRREKAA